MAAGDELTEEIDRARAALAKGDVDHASHHVGGALGLGLGLGDERLGQLLEEFARAAGDAPPEVPESGELYHGLAALRAWMLERAERLGEAAPLLLRAQAAAPDTDYLSLVERWLASPERCARLEPESLVPALHAVNGQMPEMRGRLLVLAERVLGVHAQSDHLSFAICIFRRQQGDLPGALELAQARVAERPGYWPHVALGTALRYAGQVEEAILQFESALEFEADDVAARLDIGDLRLELGDEDAALEQYQAVLAREPQHPWATASALYLRARRPGGQAAATQLLALARAHPDQDRAQYLATTLAPFWFALPPRPEASIQGLAQALATGQRAKAMGLSSYEAPSAIRAMRAALGDASADFEISFAEIPRPDPRDPIGQVPYVLWKFPRSGPFGLGRRAIEGTPGVAAPAPAHAALIAALAAGGFDRDAWWEGAAAVVAELGGETARATALGCMLHTPPCPRAELSWWTWVFQVQVAAAFVLARLERGWQPGLRRDALRSLVHGPVDWITTAALVALAEIVRREPEARAGSLELLAGALDLRPQSPVVYMCIVEPCAHLLGRLEDLPADLRARVDGLLEEIRQEH
jgi:tetratricopeptide (TPR) repeat protein